MAFFFLNVEMKLTTEESRDWKTLPHAPEPGAVIGLLADLPDGGVELFDFGPAETPFRLLLLRSGDRVFAYVNRCAHFGVPLSANKAHLHFKPHVSVSCNVHYARFRWQDGFCDFGDCEGESLLSVPVAVCDGEIRIAR